MTRWRNDSGRTLLHFARHIEPGDVFEVDPAQAEQWTALARAWRNGEIGEVADGDVWRDDIGRVSDGERDGLHVDDAANDHAGVSVDHAGKPPRVSGNPRSRRRS